jgi:hypothetical protein
MGCLLGTFPRMYRPVHRASVSYPVVARLSAQPAYTARTGTTTAPSSARTQRTNLGSRKSRSSGAGVLNGSIVAELRRRSDDRKSRMRGSLCRPRKEATIRVLDHVQRLRLKASIFPFGRFSLCIRHRRHDLLAEHAIEFSDVPVHRTGCHQDGKAVPERDACVK